MHIEKRDKFIRLWAQFFNHSEENSVMYLLPFNLKKDPS